MQGKIRPISLARRLVIDLMHASVPLVAVERTLRLERLATARAPLAVRPGWSAMMAKALCIVARDEPWLRTLYLKWPWARFYELPKSVVLVALVRDDFEDGVPIMLKLGSADERSLTDLEAAMLRGKNAPIAEIPSFARTARISRLPLLVRRLIWAMVLNSGRMRSNRFGTLWITSLASLGSETVTARTPGPTFVSYGLVLPDHSMKVRLHWDHRVYDGVVATRALRRLEEVLNNEIADELLAQRTAEPLPA
jgi:hypothetical protein